MDVYEPDVETRATVVIAAGFPGEYNKLPFVRSLGALLAESGVRAIACAHRNLHEVLSNAGSCGIWATSGNGPVALSTIMHDAPFSIRCAIFHYAYTFGAGAAAAHYGFLDPCAGKTIDDLRNDVPIFISRAGRDSFAGLNDALDSFVAAALARNMPVTVVNHPTGPHAFDLAGDSDLSQEIIRQSIAFARFHLNRATAS